MNGVSRHADESRQFNERNTGIGVEYTEVRERDVRRYLGGTLINSMGDRTWYAGGVMARRFRLGRAAHLDAGIFAGALTYPSAASNVWPALLPVLTFGTEHVAVNAVYIPAVGDKGAAATLLQLTLRLDF